MAQQSILSTSYVAGSPVTIEVLVPGSFTAGCKANLDVEVSQGAKQLLAFDISNANPKFPKNGSFEILTAAQATAAGALVRMTLLLQKMVSNTYSFQITSHQNGVQLLNNKFDGSFTDGRIEVFDLDIFLI